MGVVGIHAVVDRASMTARVGDAVYTLRVVGRDDVAVHRQDQLVGTFSCEDGESGVRVRVRDSEGARREDVSALLRIGRAWFERVAFDALAAEDAPATFDDEPPRRPSTGSRARRPLVLVVEPDDKFRRFVAFILRRRDFEVVAVDTAREARELLGARYLAVVANTKLPDGDGVELLMACREHAGALTIALADEPSASANAPGAVDLVLDAPCDLVAMLRAVEEARGRTTRGAGTG